MYLEWLFPKMVGYKLNLENPQSFNEKLQWLKLYDRNPRYTKLVDKYEVKKIVADCIGAQYVIPTIAVWNKTSNIDFESLPQQFVLKATHDSGSTIVCKDKDNFNKREAVKKLKCALKNNFYYAGREWPYKNVKPRIIAEKFIGNPKDDDLIDYKLMCFNGRVMCSFVCSDRYFGSGLKVTFYNNDWEKMPFERHYPSSEKEIYKPNNFKKMMELAEQLSIGIPFVRIDFYEVNGIIYFGEYTFYPGGGTEEFTPLEWDYKLGSWIRLPEKKRKG